MSDISRAAEADCDNVDDVIDLSQRPQRTKATRTEKIRLVLGIGAGVLLVIGGIWSGTAAYSLRNHRGALLDQSRQIFTACKGQYSEYSSLEERGSFSDDEWEDIKKTQSYIQLERQRCNEVLSAYQREADSFPVSLWADKNRLNGWCDRGC